MGVCCCLDVVQIARESSEALLLAEESAGRFLSERYAVFGVGKRCADSADSKTASEDDDEKAPALPSAASLAGKFSEQQLRAWQAEAASLRTALEHTRAHFVCHRNNESSIFGSRADSTQDLEPEITVDHCMMATRFICTHGLAIVRPLFSHSPLR